MAEGNAELVSTRKYYQGDTVRISVFGEALPGEWRIKTKGRINPDGEREYGVTGVQEGQRITFQVRESEITSLVAPHKRV